MKKLMIAVAALMITLSSYGQGSFLFNVRDTAVGNNVQFKDATGALVGASGTAATDIFIQVFANGKAVGTPMLVNGTGTRAGYPNPFSQTISDASLAAGATPISYGLYQGTSWDAATSKSDLITKNLTSGAALTVDVVLPPTPPNEVLLGAGSVSLPVIPEPTTLALGLVGLGTLLAFRRRQ